VLDLTLLPVPTPAAGRRKNAIDLECDGALARDPADPERAGSGREGDVITAADTVRVGVLGNPAASAGPAITTDSAVLAARLLGAAHAVRGAFDESSLDAPQARDAAREALGPAAFDAAYRSTADSTYRTALDLAHAALSSR
jgi:hypothetical protein